MLPEWARSVEAPLARVTRGHVLALVGLAALLGLVYVALRPVDRFRLRHFAGPRFEPIIGCLREIMKTRGLPIAVHQIWKPKYGDVFRVFAGPYPVVVTCNPAHVKIVLAHMDRLMIGRPPRSLIMTSEETLEEGIIRASIVNCPGDAYWKSVRAGWSSWLNHSEGLMEYSVTMRNAIGRLSGVLQRHAETGAELDAAALMGNLTFDVVGTTAFGVEFDTQGVDKVAHAPDLVEAARAFFVRTGIRGADNNVWALAAFCIPELSRIFWALARLKDHGQDAFLKARRMLRELALTLLENASSVAGVAGGKTAGPAGAEGKGLGKTFASLTPKPGSFVSKVKAMRHKGQPLNERQLIAQLRTFMLAGYDTTANLLSFTCYLLGRHTDVQDRLAALVRERFGREGSLPEADAVESLEYLDAVCKESLRLYPPAPVVPRRTGTEGLWLGEHFVPPHTGVFIPVFALHCDERFWSEPETFRPERFLGDKPEPSHPDAYAPFGGGPRMCVGRKFALLEAKLALVEMVRKYRWELTEGQGEPKLRVGITMGPDGPINLKLFHA